MVYGIGVFSILYFMIQNLLDITLKLFILILAFVVIKTLLGYPHKRHYNIQLPISHTPPSGCMGRDFAAILFLNKDGNIILEFDDSTVHREFLNAGGADTIVVNNYCLLKQNIETLSQIAPGRPVAIYADKDTRYSIMNRAFKSMSGAPRNSGWYRLYLVVNYNTHQ